MKKASVVGVLASGIWLAAVPANATFHLMVIDEVFFGFPEAPAAQYVMLRPEAEIQTLVRGQTVSTFSASGEMLNPFSAFCSKTNGSCDLPRVSPACATPGCPNPVEANDTRILIATPWAQDLFCVTADLLATGTLPSPNGRICFGDTGTTFGPTCLASGPVDCVAYGNFSGDNGVFGSAVPAPMPGEALSGAPARQSQCSLKTDRAAVCVGGAQANMTCPPATCPAGTCVSCPGGSCRNLLDSSAGFNAAAPMPQNYRGDSGNLDGLAGDADGSGVIEGDDIGAEIDLLFEAGTDRRCGLTVQKRGADANLDTRLSAADVVAAVLIVEKG